MVAPSSFRPAARAALAMLALILVGGHLSAAPPPTMGYQGRLLDDAGDPVSGLLTITFRLYDTATGGTALWTEIQNDVQADDGVFSVALGEATPFATSGVDFKDPYFLEIEVGGEVFEPRIPLHTTPYAATASRVADGGVDSAALAAGAVTAGKIADSALGAGLAVAPDGTLVIPSGGITGEALLDGAVRDADVADDAAIARGKLDIQPGDLAMDLVDGLAGALDAKVDTANLGAPEGVATLDIEGLLPLGQIPAAALVTVHTAADEATQLGLEVQEGDLVVRTDINRTFAARNDQNATMDDWQQLVGSGSAPVASVNGQTGTVVIDAGDIGLGNVENKALSTAGWADLGIDPTDVTAGDVGLGSVLNAPQLDRTQNLGDLPDAGAARANLGLGALALLSTVDSANLAPGAVTGEALLDGAIRNTDIADDAAIARGKLDIQPGDLAMDLVDGLAGALDAKVDTANLGAPEGVATLDIDGLLPLGQIPAAALVTVHTAADEATQLGLEVQEGDLVVRTDINRTFAARNDQNATMDDWQQLVGSGSAPVASVNGQTGTVVIDAGDIGLGNVENKALSTAGWADLGIDPTDVTAGDVGLGSVLNAPQLDRTQNLGDLPDAGAARANLGLGALALLSTVDSAHLDGNAVTSDKIADGGVTGADIQDGSVAGDDLADASIPDSKLQTISSPDKVDGEAIRLTPGGGLGTTTVNADTSALSVLLDGDTLRTTADGLRVGTLTDDEIPDTITASNYLPILGGTMMGDLSMSGKAIGDVADPVNPQDAVTLNYLDARRHGFSWKQSVRAATTAPRSLPGGLFADGFNAVDGVSIAEGDRILVKDQADPKENGIYVCFSATVERVKDMDEYEEVPSAAVFVQNGNTNEDTLWFCTNDSTAAATVGTASIVFEQIVGVNGEVTGFGLDWVNGRMDVVATDLAGDGLDTAVDGENTVLRVAGVLDARTLTNGSIQNATVAESSIDDSPIGEENPASGAFTTVVTNGKLDVRDESESIDPATGALTVLGGAGVQGQLNVGGGVAAQAAVVAPNIVECFQHEIGPLAANATFEIQHPEAVDTNMKRLVQVYYEDDPFGDGTDGEGIIANESYVTLQRDMNYTSLTVGEQATLNTAGFEVRVQGTCWVQSGGVITDGQSGGYGGMSGYSGSGGYGAENGTNGSPGEAGGTGQATGAGNGGSGGSGGGGGGGQLINAQRADGGNGGEGGYGGDGGGVVRLYCADLQNSGLIHANGGNGSAATNGGDGNYAAGTNEDVAGGGGGGGAGGDGGDGGTVEIIAGESSVLGAIEANGGDGGPGGLGGDGRTTTFTAPGGTEYAGGLGGGTAPTSGDGGKGETGADGSAPGAPGPDGANGEPGSVKTYTWTGGSLVQASNQEIRVMLTGPDTTLIRNEGEKDYTRVVVNMMYPPYESINGGFLERAGGER